MLVIQDERKILGECASTLSSPCWCRLATGLSDLLEFEFSGLIVYSQQVCAWITVTIRVLLLGREEHLLIVLLQDCQKHTDQKQGFLCMC